MSSSVVLYVWFNLEWSSFSGMGVASLLSKLASHDLFCLAYRILLIYLRGMWQLFHGQKAKACKQIIHFSGVQVSIPTDVRSAIGRFANHMTCWRPLIWASHVIIGFQIIENLWPQVFTGFGLSSHPAIEGSVSSDLHWFSNLLLHAYHQIVCLCVSDWVREWERDCVCVRVCACGEGAVE